MADSDFYMPEYWPANRLIGELETILVKAENIIGELTSDQIKNLAAAKIIGQLTDEQIKEISAAKIAGQLTNEQIEALEATKLIGQIVDAQIKEISAGKVSGVFTNAQIESIEAAKITGELTSEQIKEIAAAKIAGQISHTQIAAEAVWAINILAGSVTTEKLDSEAVTTAKLAAGSVSTAKLIAGNVTAEKLAAGSVETAKLAALAVTTAKLAAGSVSTEKLAANSVTAEKVLAGSITSVKLAAGSVTTEKLAAGSVVAEKLAVEKLSAISSNLGTVIAGRIEGIEIILPINEVEGRYIHNTLLWTESGEEQAWITSYSSGTKINFLELVSRHAGTSKAGFKLLFKSQGWNIGSKPSEAFVKISTEGNAIEIDSVTLLAEGKKSDFPRLPETQKSFLYWGTVGNNGVKGASGSGGGWTSERYPGGNPHGDYKINFTGITGKSPVPLITPLAESGVNIPRVQWFGETNVRVLMFNLSGALEDCGFTFAIPI